jgi:hypothetical protein
MPGECRKSDREKPEVRSKNPGRAPGFLGAIMPIAPLESDSTPKAG